MLYYLAILLVVPLLPLLYIQGRIIKKKVPELPEAKRPTGLVVHKDSHKEKELSILSIGESTIAGVGVDQHKNGFTGSIAKELSQFFSTNVHWKVIAKSGLSVKEVNEQLIPLLNIEELHLILIGIGGNDAFRFHSPEKWSENIIILIKKIRAKYPSTPIVFLNMPPIKAFPAFTFLLRITIGNLVEIFAKRLKKIVETQKQVFFHSATITLSEWAAKYDITDSKSIFFSDGVHPSPLTYRIWAKEMFSYIKKEKKLLEYLKQNIS